MEHITHATESIEEFFARYTKYLTEGDFDGLANIYNYPALAVTAMGCQAITELAAVVRETYGRDEGLTKSAAS